MTTCGRASSSTTPTCGVGSRIEARSRAARASRPVCAVIAVKHANDQTHLALLAISSRPAGADQISIEVPEIECKRAGLSELKQAWVTVSEYNYDIAERSFHLDPNKPVLGRFSRSFLRQIASAAAPLFRMRHARVDRTD